MDLLVTSWLPQVPVAKTPHVISSYLRGKSCAVAYTCHDILLGAHLYEVVCVLQTNTGGSRAVDSHSMIFISLRAFEQGFFPNRTTAVNENHFVYDTKNYWCQHMETCSQSEHLSIMLQNVPRSLAVSAMIEAFTYHCSRKAHVRQWLNPFLIEML